MRTSWPRRRGAISSDRWPRTPRRPPIGQRRSELTTVPSTVLVPNGKSGLSVPMRRDSPAASTIAVTFIPPSLPARRHQLCRDAEGDLLDADRPDVEPDRRVDARQLLRRGDPLRQELLVD